MKACSLIFININSCLNRICLLQELDEIYIKKEKMCHTCLVSKENLESLGWENWKLTLYSWPPEICVLFQASYAHVWRIMCFRLRALTVLLYLFSAKKIFLVTVTATDLYVYLIKFSFVRSDFCLLSGLLCFFKSYLFLPLRSIPTKWYRVM